MSIDQNTNRIRRSYLAWAIVLFIGLSPLPLWFFYASFAPREPETARLVSWVPVVLFLGCASVLVWIPLGVTAVFVKPLRYVSKIGIATSLLFILTTSISFVPAASILRREHAEAIHAIAENSKPLIDAIEAYRLNHDGRGPATLDELIPQYLKAIPSTGASCCPEYRLFHKEEIPNHYPPADWMIEVELPISLHADRLFFHPAQNYHDAPLQRSTMLIPIGDGRNWGYLQ